MKKRSWVKKAAVSLLTAAMVFGLVVQAGFSVNAADADIESEDVVQVQDTDTATPETACENGADTAADEASEAISPDHEAPEDNRQEPAAGVGTQDDAECETNAKEQALEGQSDAAESEAGGLMSSEAVMGGAPQEVTSIYLNGMSGDDSKDGTTAGNAVKTFARAKELATANQSVTTIYVTGPVSISGEISLKGTNAILKRDPSFNDYLMTVDGNASATLSDITVDGNSEEAVNTTRSLINSEGVLNIKDGTVLQNNVLTDLGYFHADGGAIHTNRGVGKSVVNMTGGVIQNNIANHGGGIFVNYTTFNMSGGTIRNNHAVDGTGGLMEGMAAGGGVTVYDGSTFNLSGNAVIADNVSDNIGGGISVGTGVGSNGKDTLNMTGGMVTGNSAGSGGGGILVQAGYLNAYGTANISGGVISNNVMNAEGTGNNAFGGGGIYVNGYSNAFPDFHNGVLNITNAIIEKNSASMEGGGYASCPNSETHFYVKNGVALYGNSAGSANEIYILASNAYGAHSGDPIYTISPIMLGGTPYHWKYEDGSEVPLNMLDGQLFAIYNQSLSLHTEVTEDAGAEDLAKVIISGNASATRGAGIGSNGTVNMGERELTEVGVTKLWADDEDHPQSVVAELYRTAGGGSEDPVYVGHETVREADGWSLTFTNLPKNDAWGNPYIYTVKERPVEGYVAVITGTQEDGYTITNERAVSVSASKVWEDFDDKEGKRPDSVTVRLYADGEAAGGPVSLDDRNGWTYTWTDLPMKKNGSDIRYTVDEPEVPDGYSKAVTGDANEGFTITNTYTPVKPPQAPPKKDGETSPHTGDDPHMMLYVFVMIVSVTVLTTEMILMKRRKLISK